MSRLPGSPPYGLALSDPPRDRSGPRPTFWLAVRRKFLAYANQPGSANRIVIRVKSIVQR